MQTVNFPNRNGQGITMAVDIHTPAGLSAALKLVESGRSVLLAAKGEGGFQLSQGTVDVLGYSPGRVANPLAAIGELPAGHPYASIGAEKVRDAVAWLRDTLGEELLVGDPAQLGALVQTDLVKWAKVVKDTGATVD